MMGEWTVSKMESSDVTINKQNTIGMSFYTHTTTSATNSFDGSNLTSTVKKDYTNYPTNPSATTSKTTTDRYSKTISLTLDKHGVAKSTETQTQISVTVLTTPAWGCATFPPNTPGKDCDGTYTYSGTGSVTSSTYEGKWSWRADNKNKEQVFIDLNGTIDGIYMIDQLKNKEIILKQNYISGDTNNSTSDNSSNNITYTNDVTLTGK